jgi:hypothetical protein
MLSTFLASPGWVLAQNEVKGPALLYARRGVGDMSADVNWPSILGFLQMHPKTPSTPPPQIHCCVQPFCAFCLGTGIVCDDEGDSESCGMCFAGSDGWSDWGCNPACPAPGLPAHDPMRIHVLLTKIRDDHVQQTRDQLEQEDEEEFDADVKIMQAYDEQFFE